jgi:hypothetical protein
MKTPASLLVRRLNGLAAAALAVALAATACTPPPPEQKPQGKYPWHTNIVATTFWVGEIFDPNAEDGSQVTSTYDSQWMKSYGGCDGRITSAGCQTEARSGSNGYAPSSVKPKENAFYLDLPYDDIHNAAAFRERATVIPWANDEGYKGQATNPSFSYMKNRWVKIRKDGKECYGQIQDAGPGEYQDKEYVFGSNDARPVNKQFHGAGMDVSPALNGCLGFGELDGESDKVDWQFVDQKDVPPGPWLDVVTVSQVK